MNWNQNYYKTEFIYHHLDDVEDVGGQQSDANTIKTLAMPQQSTETIQHDDSREERLSIEPHCPQDTTLAVSQQSPDTVHHDDSLEERSSIQPSCPRDTTPVVPQHSTDMVHHDDSLEERPSIRYLINPTMFDNEDPRYKAPPSYYNVGMSINHPYFPYDARCLPRQTESSSASDGQQLFDYIFDVEFYYIDTNKKKKLLY